MSYIGREPTIGNFQICDAISVVNNQAAYTMQVGSVNVLPETANHMIVSLNGTIQKPNSSFTVSGSTITFSSNLVTNDVIDFIQILGDVLDLGVPSDATVTTAKLASTSVTTAKLADSSVSLAKLTASGTKDATTFLRGDNTFASAAGGLQSTQVFTSSGTYTKPSGINKIRVFVTGGGGAGGNGDSGVFYSAAGGGAAGGTAIELLDASSMTTVTVTIGAGAIRGGAASGTSSFGSFCSATGGTNGKNTNGAGGTNLGGHGVGGDLNLYGQGGGGSFAPTTQTQGIAGGNSYWGGGAGGVYSQNGVNGYHGGGGSGGNVVGSGGGNGGPGICYIEEYA